ncbi:putative choline transporter, neither null mutation nor overexpression affects choline transport, partial [Coemansia sp. RSA 486]
MSHYYDGNNYGNAQPAYAHNPPYGYDAQQSGYDGPQPGYAPPSQPPPPQNYQQFGSDQYQQQPQQQQHAYGYPPPPPPAPPAEMDATGYSSGGFKGAKQFNRTPKFRDLWAALLFLAHFALFVVMAALFIRALPSSAFKNSGNLKFTKDFYSWPTMIMWLCVLLVSIVFSVIYLGILQMFTGQMLVISFWFSVIAMIGTGIYYLAAKIWFAGGIMLIFGVLYALMWFSWRHRIPFSKVVLETVCHITRKFPSTMVVSLAFLIVQTAYSAMWSLALAGSFKYMEKYQSCSTHVDRNGR